MRSLCWMKKNKSLKKIFLLILFVLQNNYTFGQDSTLISTTNYSIVMMDSPAKLFTMRQFNESYVSFYGFFSKSLHTHIKSKFLANLIEPLIQGLILMPLTHEEGHRSVLTAKGIGSISQPFFNKDGLAYVNGVTDQTLINLKNSDPASYIRLHNGGLESDYMIAKRIEDMVSFDKADYKYYNWEYFSRKAGVVQYIAMGLFEYELDKKEEKNELDRDIVGHDVYGTVRHLFRPDMEFYRYTRYKDLTKREKEYLDNLGYHSFLNLLNPILFGKSGFRINKDMKVNLGAGHMLAPFGEFVDENIWLKYKGYNISLYLRQFHNKNHWSNGIGIGIHEYDLSNKIIISLRGHYWKQPQDYSFTTADMYNGGAIDLKIRYRFWNDSNKTIPGFSYDFGFVSKTKGFLPEEVMLEEHNGFRLGFTLEMRN